MGDSRILSRLLLYGGLALAAGAFLVWQARRMPSLPGLHFPPDTDRLKNYGKPDPGWTLRALDGKEVRLADFRGRVVVLNVWATWCRPCVAEVPGLQSLHDTMRKEGVEVVAASGEPSEHVREFVNGRQWHLPVYTFFGAPPEVLDSEGIPATFILDRGGRVVFRHVGAGQWDSEECRHFLRRVHEAGDGR